MMKDLKDFLEAYEVDQTQSLDAKNQGSIYPAKEKSTGQLWAVKWSELHPKFDRGLLQQRYQHAQQLDHPNLLSYHQSFRFDTPMIVELALLPIVPKGSLAELTTPLSVEEKTRIAAQVLDGLHYLHQLGIVWQNLSASHILLEELDGIYTPKFINYGNVEKIPLAFFSNYEYVAPEQFKADALVDVRMDIWAYGVLLYKLWTGRLPFGKKSASLSNATLQARITGEEVWELGLLSSIPAPYQSIVEKCLKRAPTERWANCGQIIAALEEWENTAQNTPPVLEEAPVIIEEERRFLRKPSQPINWWLVLLLFLLAIALGQWLG